MTDQPEALAAIKASLARARDLELEIKDGEARLAAQKAALYTLEHSVLPTQFNSAGVRTLTIEADGNIPSYACTLKPYYKAVIPAKWDEAKREEALAELEAHGGGDLAKRVVSISFPRSESNACKELCDQLSELGYSYSVSFEIHHQTLTAWLRETIEDGGEMPDLEKIGGQVGQVVTLKVTED